MSMEGAPNLRVDIREEREVVYFVRILADGGLVNDRGQVDGDATLPPSDQPRTE